MPIVTSKPTSQPAPAPQVVPKIIESSQTIVVDAKHEPLQSLITQVAGFIGLVIGLAIQISSWFRNRKTLKLEEQAEDRARLADDRDKAQYELQMKVLAKQLIEIEQGLTDGKPK